MSWVYVTEEEMERQREQQMEQFRKACDEAARLRREKEEFIQATTCPHCGRHAPLPIQYQMVF